MKYNESNKPLVCMQTQSTCYKGTKKMEVKGVLWHDTGANNPNLKRYVQPSDNAADRDYWLKVLGKNQYNNDWNHIDRQAGLNCWIGKLADGTVTTVQTMPWDYRPWGCGSGSKGSCNSGWIQFEICEDGKTDKAYFEAAYKEACEITAYLRKMFGIDPHGTVKLNGVTVPTILCHQDSYKLGLGGNHSDIYDWFPNFGKDMTTVRDDVAKLLAEDAAVHAVEAPAVPAVAVGAEDNEKAIWDRLYATIQNPYGVAGVMGNFMAESSLRANNLQNTYEKSLGMSDDQYTAAVDSGAYTNFVHDSAGYGLYQATYWSIKESLLNYAKTCGKSIGDRDLQVDHFLKMMKEEYTAIWKVLTTATTVREASDAVLLKFERPADQSEAVQVKRAGFGQTYFDKYAPAASTVPSETAEEKKPAIAVSATQAKYINATGTHYISNSGSDENGAYTGGQAGDQNGKEWQLRSWYNRPWTVVLRHPDQAVALKIALLGIDAALNNLIGYDQNQRGTYWTQLQKAGYEPSKITVACEEDCSAGVCANIKAAGFLLGIKALQTHTGTYTGNMKSTLVKAGFKALTDSKYLTTGDYLLPGDILLNESHHTATNVTIGAKVKGSWNPGSIAADETPAAPAAPSATVYYRVRKTWEDKASQIGAYTVLQNAKNCVDANPGYAAFDEAGKQVYPVVTGSAVEPVKERVTVPFLVRISIDDLNIRKGAGTNYSKTGKYTGKGVFTIVEVASGQGSDSGWGRLKSGAGWVSLDYCQKV